MANAPPSPRDLRTPPPPPAHRGAWVILAVALVASLLVIVSVAGYLWYYSTYGWTMKLTPHDLSILLSATKFEELQPGMVIRTDKEKISKTRRFDRGVELTYRYVHPDADFDLVIHQKLIVEPTRKASYERYKALEKLAQARIADRLPTHALIDMPFIGVGDHSRFARATEAESDREGYFAVCRSGRNVMMLWVIAPSSAPSELVWDLISDSTDLIPKYDPEGLKPQTPNAPYSP